MRSRSVIPAPSFEIKPVLFYPCNRSVGEGVLGPTNSISITSSEILLESYEECTVMVSVKIVLTLPDIQDSVMLADMFKRCVAIPFFTL